MLSQQRIGNNRFEFALNGESNRFYRIESSTNGFAWATAQYFIRDFSGFTSILSTSNSTTSVSVPNDAVVKFFRAVLYTPANDVCNNNLRRIRYSKVAWARQFQMDRYATPTWADLGLYIPGAAASLGTCPVGGSYIANSVLAAPMCSVSNHILEEPW